jgi:hypothetical protein
MVVVGGRGGGEPRGVLDSRVLFFALRIEAARRRSLQLPCRALALGGSEVLYFDILGVFSVGALAFIAAVLLLPLPLTTPPAPTAPLHRAPSPCGSLPKAPRIHRTPALAPRFTAMDALDPPPPPPLPITAPPVPAAHLHHTPSLAVDLAHTPADLALLPSMARWRGRQRRRRRVEVGHEGAEAVGAAVAYARTTPLP